MVDGEGRGVGEREEEGAGEGEGGAEDDGGDVLGMMLVEGGEEGVGIDVLCIAARIVRARRRS